MCLIPKQVLACVGLLTEAALASLLDEKGKDADL
jgi:hypothetical protein